MRWRVQTRVGRLLRHGVRCRPAAHGSTRPSNPRSSGSPRPSLLAEKLRDKAQRNGNINWDSGHVILADFLRQTLIGSGLFDAETEQTLSDDLDRVLEYETPETGDEPYDRISARVVDWARAHPEPVPHVPNARLHR